MSAATVTEEWLTPEETAGRVPGPAVAASTVRRWISEGVNGVRLRALRRVGRVFVGPSDLEEFLRQVTSDCEAAS